MVGMNGAPTSPPWVILLSLAYHGYVLAIAGVAAPWIMATFGLGEAGLAKLFAWLSLSAVGALGLSRLLDRLGRRRVTLWCLGATPICAVGAGLAADPRAFVLFAILLYSMSAAMVASGVVLIAEQHGTAGRARGQGLGGIALGLGSGSCVVLMPAVVGLGLSWRWLFLLAGGGLLILPLAARKLNESICWTRQQGRAASPTTLFGLFEPPLRSHSLPLLASGMLSAAVVTAASTWRYFHAVSVVGLSPAVASTLLVGTSGLALVGFAIGARACERFGRVPTVGVSALVVAAGIAWLFWGPPSGSAHPLVWLGLGFLAFGVASNAMTVGGNCAATELFPATQRGTMIGWLHVVGCVGQIAAQGVIAALAPRLGGISPVVGWVGVLAVGVSLIFLLLVRETRGRPLPSTAPETEAARALSSWTP